MGMNLTGLADAANAQLALEGRPREIDLDDIVPDPSNPRNADDETLPAAIEAQEELDADVAQRGIRSPISVRLHPTLLGKYIINYGHRRYRSARRNGLLKIPAFVDETFDSYDQVNENELRIGLSTRARALFIKRRLDAGDSNGEIAARLHKKNQTFVTEHLALLDAPECVNQAYAKGVTSARTLYDLRQMWDEFPAQTDAWARDVVRVTREGIREAVERFRHDEASASDFNHPVQPESAPSLLRHDEERQPTPPSLASRGTRGDECRDAETPRQHQLAPRADAKVKKSKVFDPASPTLPLSDCSSDTRMVRVRYRGMLGWIVPDATVSIFIDGNNIPMEVPVSELTFDSD